MKKRHAVIDLGTNTFHVLIAEEGDDELFHELYRKRIFIKLAEDGIQRIGDAPFKRGLQAIHSFKEILDQYEVSSVKAFGTAALRTAENGLDFIHTIRQQTGIEVQLIPGEREAELIHKGVVQAVDIGEKAGLIMDIGGGSVEFIIANFQGVHWAQSFPIGVAVLFNHFHKSDPISDMEVEVFYQYLTTELSPLLLQLKKYQPTILIGASGTFDVLEAMLAENRPSKIHSIVQVEAFNPLFKKLLKTTLQERIDMPEIPKTRSEMIIVALILIDFILKQAPIKTISVSAYAMKEGMLSELIDDAK